MWLLAAFLTVLGWGCYPNPSDTISEGGQPKMILVRSMAFEGLWPVITGMALIQALPGLVAGQTFGQASAIWRNLECRPMRHGPHWRIMIFHHQHMAPDSPSDGSRH